MNLPNHIVSEVEKFSAQLPGQPKELYEPISYILSLGGKRMRPLLVLMGCDLFGGDVNAALPQALGIEVFHNFTLVHDDIMDNAPLRRNKATVHEKWDTNTAILSGDTMLVKAYQSMAKCPPHLLPAILDLFSKTAIEVCEGQQLDMNFEKQHKVSIAQYVNMITLKTAVLLAAALKIGAWTGGAREEDAQRLYEFGKNIGIAFQLQDDILDVYGLPEKFGKQVGGDIISNKKTFLLLKAFELADKYTSENLNNWMYTAHVDNAKEKVEAVTAIYDFLHIKEIARKEMMRYYEIGIHALQEIPVGDEKKKTLIDFVNQLIVREL